MYSTMPPELLKICNSWSMEIEKLPFSEDHIRFFKKHLPKLLMNSQLFSSVLKNIVKCEPYPDLRRSALFDDEILLYLHPRRLYSLRMFLFDPEEFTSIHDHSAWGVTGTVFNSLSIIKYKREDDGAIEDVAHIVETERLNLEPGATDVTLPLGEGIHTTGNASKKPMIMVSIYGSPIRRLYVNRYDPRMNRVFKIFPPRIRKRRKAEAALAHIG